MPLHHTPEELHEPEYDPVEIINALWNKPGMSWEELHAYFGVSTLGEHRGFDKVTRELLEGRIRVVRFTTYAPSLRTTFRLFPMEKGRLEIVNEGGSGFDFILDDFGEWDSRMEEALRDA